MTFKQTGGRFVATFDVTGPPSETPVQGNFQTNPIFPRQLRIEWHPPRTSDFVGMSWSVEITGPRVKKDGKPSAATASANFAQWKSNMEIPDVVRDAITLTSERARVALYGDEA